jgi:hypothetical protein
MQDIRWTALEFCYNTGLITFKEYLDYGEKLWIEMAAEEIRKEVDKEIVENLVSYLKGKENG